MASLAGNLHRPLSAMAALAVAAVTSDLPDKFSHPRPSKTSPVAIALNAASMSSSSREAQSWVSWVSISNLSGLWFMSTAWSNVSCLVANSTLSHIANSNAHLYSVAVAPSPVLLTPYVYAKLSKPRKYTESQPSMSSSPSEVMYRWHLPEPSAYMASGRSECSSATTQTVVILLGWLGAKQKHLKRYAEWYTTRGFHAVTFTFPMADIMSYMVGGKGEQNLELLASHLAGWVAEEHGKNLVFHTFSNTGWLTYGVILEKFQKQDPSLLESIKGCIVDSAPVAAPNAQVWASGFSAAFLKKHSVARKGTQSSCDSGVGILVAADSGVEPKPAAAETALLAVLEKFFEVVLNIPAINRRLSDVLDILSSEQPKCPQLYVYSSADRVIPVKSVESFIEAQLRAGHEVRACDFISSPHVDHFRNHPALYTFHLTTFLEDCVLTCCRDSC